MPVSAETLPVPLIGRSLLPLLFALLLWFACTWLGVQLLRRKVPCGLLGPWLGYVVGGAIFGVLISLLAIIIDGIGLDMWAVSYTHLDVYKRQGQARLRARMTAPSISTIAATTGTGLSQ